MLVKIAEVFGWDELNALRLQLKREKESPPPQFQRRNLVDAFKGNEELATPDAQNLVVRLLALDPAARLSAKEALAHPFFKP